LNKSLDRFQLNQTKLLKFRFKIKFGHTTPTDGVLSIYRHFEGENYYFLMIEEGKIKLCKKVCFSVLVRQSKI
jgi:hypothetical protein